ncbi:MAG TPA: class I SAM-dependent methyltransferase [Candidatus Bathyarchaeia archaeon]|nr:class I SAM-dependent methyltransferase [Candidatus Bathyarchaeia archaeon]
MRHRLADDDDLELCLKQIGEIFDIQGMINQSLTTEHIVHYYTTNKLAQLLWSSEGFFHYGISYDGRYKKADLQEPARLVERYIRNTGASNVLELASGLGANTAFLARRNPNVMFEAIDISNKPLKRYTSLLNVHFRFCDYHDLSGLGTSYNLIFVIEALCCSTNKERVLREAKRKLEPGGKLIVFDGYKRRRIPPLTRSEERMWGLIEKSLSVDRIERLDDVEGYMEKEFLIEAAQDLSEYVLPSTMRFRPLIRLYLSHPAVARAINRIAPLDFMKNAIHLRLLSISLARQIGCYYMHVLANDR